MLPVGLQSTEKAVIGHTWRRVEGSASRGRREIRSVIHLGVGSKIENTGYHFFNNRVKIRRSEDGRTLYSQQ